MKRARSGRKLLKELEEEAPQNWKSLIGGRAFGLAGVYAVIFGLTQKRNERAVKFLGDKASQGLNRLGFKKAARAKSLHGITEMVVFDSFYSAVAAGGLYIYSHFLKPPQNGHTDSQPLEPAASPNAAPLTTEETKQNHDNWQQKVKKPTSKPAYLAPSTDHQSYILAAEENLASEHTVA